MIGILPEIIFSFLILIFLIAFFWIIKILYYTEGVDLEKKKKNIVFLTIVIIVILVPYLVSLLLQKGERMRPLEILEVEQPEFLVEFPPNPSFVEIEDYYFAGPWQINERYQESPGALWIVLCENDIIGTGFFFPDNPVFTSEQRQCFLTECSNPYYATLPIFKDGQIPGAEKLFNYLINKFNPQCNIYE